MNSIAIAGLLPVALFLVIALVIAVFARRQAAAGGGGFVTEYFIGNRSLGPFVLAMTTIATYGSVSSFVGGPGQAWSIGWGWVYMATVQVTALFLLYGIVVFLIGTAFGQGGVDDIVVVVLAKKVFVGFDLDDENGLSDSEGEVCHE